MANYVFNDTTGAQDGLIQECEDITTLGAGKISGDTAKMKTFTRRINQAGDRFFVIAMKFDQLWKWDDRRYADSEQKLPIATTNLLSGTRDYIFDEDFLTIEQLFVKDNTGVYQEVEPQDDRNEPSFYKGTESGVPTKYELVGNSIGFDKTPNYTPTLDGQGKNQGIKAVFRRKGTNFVYTQGAVPINVPQIFFEYVANRASLPYLREKGLKHYTAVRDDLEKMEQIHIPNFFANRAKPKRAGLRVKEESNK